MVTDNDVARRSGRVTHQTSRRSFSSRLVSSLLFSSRLSSPPSSLPSSLSSLLFDSFLASLSFGFFLRIVPTGSTFVNAHRRLRGFDNTGNILDPDRNRTHRSKERFANERRRGKKRIPFFFVHRVYRRFTIVSTFHLGIVLKIRLKSLFLPAK